MVKAEPRVDRFGDPLPEGAMARLGAIRFFHGSRTIINGPAFSPDGRVITLNTNRKSWFWDTVSGQEIVAADSVGESPVFPANNQLLAVEVTASATRLRDALNGRVFKEFGPIIPTRSILGLTPDGGTLIWMEANIGRRVVTQSLRYADATTGVVGEPVSLLDSKQLHGFTFSADSRTVAILNLDGTIVIFDLAKKNVTVSIPIQLIQIGQSKMLPSLALSPSGSLLAVTGGTQGLQFFETLTGRELPLPQGPEKNLSSGSFSPDGKLFACESSKSYPMIILWDVATRREIRRFPIFESGRIAFSPDGTTLATASSDSVKLWDPVTGKPRHDFGHNYAIWSFAFAPNGETILSGASYSDRTARVWDPFTGALRARWEGHAAGVQSVAFAPDGSFAATGSQDGTICIWDTATNTEIRKLVGSYGHLDCVAISPDGQTLAAASRGHGIRLWELATGKELRTLDQIPINTLRVAFSRDGRWLASFALDENSAYLTDIASGQIIRRFGGHAKPVMSIALSAHGQLLATATYDGTIRVWNLASGAQLYELASFPGAYAGGAAWVYGLAFSPDGRSLTGAYQDNSVRVWEIASRTVRAKYDGHRGSVLHVEYSPDGKLLASSGADRTLLVWDYLNRNSFRNPPKGSNLSQTWSQLSDADARVAFRAVSALVALPEVAVAILRHQLKPPAAVDPATIRGLIGELDSTQFAVRQKAMQQLETVVDQAADELRAALVQSKSAEVRQAVQRLLDRLAEPTPEMLRAIRAVEVLEHIATPAARQLLTDLAKGAPGARLTVEAKASFERLKAR
jgi:WD40 repeat protein